jgi:hypothetical protein
MWSAIASLFLGILGWFATSLVFEEMIFTANVDQIVEGTPPLTGRRWKRCVALARRYWQPMSQHHDSYGGSFPKGDMT